MSTSATDIQRLRWRCRRGMRELDVLLSKWLDLKYVESGPESRALFDQLLDCEDDKIWDWMMGRDQPPDELAGLVEQICRVHERGRPGS